MTIHITWYRCLGCNHRVVAERIAGDELVELGYHVTNDYLPISPRRMVAALAGKLALGSQS